MTLPDRYLEQPPPARVARYEGCTLWMMELTGMGAGQFFDLHWPSSGSARLCDLSAADAAALGVNEIIEFAPLPFALAATLRALPCGAPTFYLGLDGIAPSEHALLQASDLPFSVARAWLGVLFQDRLVRAHWGWIDAIGDALSVAAPDEEAAWRTMGTLFDAVRAMAQQQVLTPHGLCADHLLL